MKFLTIVLLLISFQVGGQNEGSKLSTFLMFEGNAENAMEYYISLFENSEIEFITRYDDTQPSMTGKIKYAKFQLNGMTFMCSDSPIEHEFTFTPSISVFVDCETSNELDKLFKSLSNEGKVLMPVDNYGFSEKFGWVEDKFGVSWQLNYGELK